MSKAKCQYCGRTNNAKKKAAKKSCPLCFFWGWRAKNKKIKRQEKIRIVLWAIKQRQECSNCGSKERLTLDRIVPGSKGGKYEVKNLQILCQPCNCTVKINYSSFEESAKDNVSRKCLSCGKEKILSTTNFHRLIRARTKNRNNSICNWHPRCKQCRKEEIKTWIVKCIFCGKTAKASSNVAKFCSRECKYRMHSANRRKEICCQNCGKEAIVTKSSAKKFCDNKCSAEYWQKNNIGIYKKSV